tara:strand:+ start:8912 stop:9154 length:243 start_codon:yes stop_codon:yes gene_type:complete
MKIKIRCFSQVKYAIGVDQLIINLRDGSDTSDIEKIVREKAKGKLDGVTLRTALNKVYLTNPKVVKDGDEVAFIPPVQGG